MKFHILPLRFKWVKCEAVSSFSYLQIQLKGPSTRSDLTSSVQQTTKISYLISEKSGFQFLIFIMIRLIINTIPYVTLWSLIHVLFILSNHTSNKFKKERETQEVMAIELFPENFPQPTNLFRNFSCSWCCLKRYTGSIRQSRKLL